jgi:hypothetical protein
VKINIIILLLLISCNRKPAQDFAFEKFECNTSETPAYDGQVVTLLDNQTGKPLRDTIVERIPKTRIIFKPCREYIYLATYKDSQNRLISSSKVWMMATGKRWEGQKEKQDEIIVQYEYDDEETKEINTYFVNKGMVNNPWQTKSKEGIVENIKGVWMHPFRLNQYNFTEVAPFPEVKFPMQVGQTWTSQLSIGQGWGDWSNTSIDNEYKVTELTTLKTPYKEFRSCWKVYATAGASFGESTHEYWFDEGYGFVKMHYTNYKDQTLTFELIDVVDK